MRDTGFGGEESDRAYHWGRMSERDAIVAWLRSTTIGRLWGQDPLDAAADAIERGEHRKEEES